MQSKFPQPLSMIKTRGNHVKPRPGEGKFTTRIHAFLVFFYNNLSALSACGLSSITSNRSQKLISVIKTYKFIHSCTLMIPSDAMYLFGLSREKTDRLIHRVPRSYL